MSLSERIKEARKALNMGQKEFAVKLEIIYQSVSKYERGEIKPTAELMTKLAETYKININWLLTGNGEMFLDQEKRAKEPKDDGFDEIIKALQKLTPDRQKYYYHKIMAESLERSGEEDETKSPQAREEHDALFA